MWMITVVHNLGLLRNPWNSAVAFRSQQPKPSLDLRYVPHSDALLKRYQLDSKMNKIPKIVGTVQDRVINPGKEFIKNSKEPLKR